MYFIKPRVETVLILQVFLLSIFSVQFQVDSDANGNSPVLQSARPRAVDSGEAKMRTASWENVDKQMPRKIRNNTWACFKWPKNVDKTASHWNTQYNDDLQSL